MGEQRISALPQETQSDSSPLHAVYATRDSFRVHQTRHAASALANL